MKTIDMLITEKWLKNKNACFPFFEFVKNENWIDLPFSHLMDLLIWSKRLPDANWLITRYMSKSQNIKFAGYANYMDTTYGGGATDLRVLKYGLTQVL